MDEVVLKKSFSGSTYPVIRLIPLCDVDFDIEMRTYYWDVNGNLLDEDRAIVDTLGSATENYLNGNHIREFREEDVFHIEQILDVWESDSVNLETCIEIQDSNHIKREDSAVTSLMQWGVSVYNSCDRALEVHLDYLAYDSLDQLVRRFSAVGYPVPAYESRTYSNFGQILNDSFEQIDSFVPEVDFVRPFAEEIDIEARFWSSNVLPVYDAGRSSVSLTATNSYMEAFAFELVSKGSSESARFSVDLDTLEPISQSPAVSGSYDNAQGILSFPSLRLDTGERFHSLQWEVEDHSALELVLKTAKEGIDTYDYRGGGPKCLRVQDINSQVQEAANGGFNYSFEIEIENNCLWGRTYAVLYSLLDQNFLGELGRIEIVDVPPLESKKVELVGEIPADLAYYPISRESVSLISVR